MAIPAVIHGLEFVEQLCEALGLPVQQTRRIIIDVQYDCTVSVYAEMYGSQKILDLDWDKGLAGAKVSIIDAK